MTMKNMGTKLAAVTALMLAASPAYAGKGGSAGLIRSAVQSGSVDAIIAEVERAESLMCTECVDLVVGMLDDNRYEVREVAAWWLAKRPSLMTAFSTQFVLELATGDTIQVRNAADFLGSVRMFTALPTLREAIKRDIGAEGKVAMVRAVSEMAHIGGNPVLTVAMADGQPTVRAAAVKAWREIRGQQNAAPVVGMLGDADATVRAEAATVIGAMGEVAGRAQLEALVVSDASPIVRRNAAWALGKLGQSASRAVLTQASTDDSGLVRLVAKAALSSLK
jgi:HEAT repeat protein